MPHHKEAKATQGKTQSFVAEGDGEAFQGLDGSRGERQEDTGAWNLSPISDRLFCVNCLSN